MVEALWDDLAQQGAARLTEAQRAELDRRIADLDANPDDVVPWSEVKGSAMGLLKR